MKMPACKESLMPQSKSHNMLIDVAGALPPAS